MAGIPRLFTFKCSKGHETQRLFPPGTTVDEEDETTCEECLDDNETERAYVVFVCSAPTGEKRNGSGRS